jgi:hypothetical protein
MNSTRFPSSRWFSVSVSSSRRLIALLAFGTAGCVGPWNDLPSEDPVRIRAAVAVFVQQGDYATATFSRPLDAQSEKGLAVRWIDPSRSMFRVEESGPGCDDTPARRKSSSLYSFSQTSGSDWTYSTSSSSSLASCGSGSVWRLRGHLRWNASSPFSQAEPVWVTDSVDASGEISTRPMLLHENIAGPLELRWSTLARADASTRASWSRDSQTLANLVAQWKSIQTARGRDARVLASGTTAKPSVWKWSDLDTSLLRKILVSATTSYGTGIDGVQSAFSAGDSLWLPQDHSTWVDVFAAGTSRSDHFAAVRLLQLNAESIVDVSPSNWSGWTNWLNFVVGRAWSKDTTQVFFMLPQKSQWPVRMELAVAGTCAGQRDFLHLGGTDRQKLPHGNAAPLDGFVCEVQTDTITFPLGQ